VYQRVAGMVGEGSMLQGRGRVNNET